MSAPRRIALENGLVVFLVKTAIVSALAPCGSTIAVIVNAISTGIGRFMVSLPWYGTLVSYHPGKSMGMGRRISPQNALALAHKKQAKPGRTAWWRASLQDRSRRCWWP